MNDTQVERGGTAYGKGNDCRGNNCGGACCLLILQRLLFTGALLLEDLNRVGRITAFVPKSRCKEEF